MYKPTKRKAFNFLRSYYDVLNELTNDKDKLDFLMAIINKQFLDEDPKDLNFIVNLCYSSQKHAIESSIKGWKRASKDDVSTDVSTNPQTNPMTNPPTNPMTNHKEEEEKEEEKEQEQVQDVKMLSDEEVTKRFTNWFNSMLEKHKGKIGKFKTMTKADLTNLKKLKKHYTPEDFEYAFTQMLKNDWIIENNKATIDHFVRNDNFVRYLNTESTKQSSPDVEWVNKQINLYR